MNFIYLGRPRTRAHTRTARSVFPFCACTLKCSGAHTSSFTKSASTQVPRAYFFFLRTVATQPRYFSLLCAFRNSPRFKHDRSVMGEEAPREIEQLMVKSTFFYPPSRLFHNGEMQYPLSQYWHTSSPSRVRRNRKKARAEPFRIRFVLSYSKLHTDNSAICQFIAKGS